MFICLTQEELKEITGFKKFNSQYKWLKENGFRIMTRKDGMPLISRAHFEQVMGVMISRPTLNECEPDYSSLL